MKTLPEQERDFCGKRNRLPKTKSTNISVSNADGDCLAGWASINSFAILYNPKDSGSFHSGRWDSGNNPDLAFASVDWDSRLPDRHVLEKSSRLQRRTSLITPPRLALPVPSIPVER